MGWAAPTAVGQATKERLLRRPRRTRTLVQCSEDAVAAQGYGERHPDEFGGLYWAGRTLVVLFTDHVDEHERRLAEGWQRRRRVRLAEAPRTWREVARANEELAERLLPGVPAVTAYGIAVARGQFVVRVGVLPERYADPQVRERVRQLCRPHDVVLEPAKPFMPLPLPAPPGVARPPPSHGRTL